MRSVERIVGAVMALALGSCGGLKGPICKPGEGPCAVTKDLTVEAPSIRKGLTNKWTFTMQPRSFLDGDFSAGIGGTLTLPAQDNGDGKTFVLTATPNLLKDLLMFSRQPTKLYVVDPNYGSAESAMGLLVEPGLKQEIAADTPVDNAGQGENSELARPTSIVVSGRELIVTQVSQTSRAKGAKSAWYAYRPGANLSVAKFGSLAEMPDPLTENAVLGGGEAGIVVADNCRSNDNTPNNFVRVFTVDSPNKVLKIGYPCTTMTMDSVRAVANLGIGGVLVGLDNQLLLFKDPKAQPTKLQDFKDLRGLAMGDTGSASKHAVVLSADTTLTLFSVTTTLTKVPADKLAALVKPLDQIYAIGLGRLDGGSNTTLILANKNNIYLVQNWATTEPILSSPYLLPDLMPGDTITSVAAGDLTNSGYQDIIVGVKSSDFSGSLRVLRNRSYCTSQSECNN